MSKANSIVFSGLRIVAWIIFVGLCIEAGGLLVNFVVSLLRPELVSRLYQKLDLSDMYRRSIWIFLGMYSFILTISFFKVALFYRVVILVTKIDLAKPFSSFVSRQITVLSYYTLAIGLFSAVARQIAKSVRHHGVATERLSEFWADSQAFILMAAVIYVIAAIFKKGLEIQNENDLTV